MWSLYSRHQPELDTIECESAEAALAVMLIGGQHVALIFADIRLSGVMDGIDLAHEMTESCGDIR